MNPVSSGFEEWIQVFCARLIWSKEGNFTGGHDCYMRRAYLKYVTNFAIMLLDQSDRGVNIPTPAHGK